LATNPDVDKRSIAHRLKNVRGRNLCEAVAMTRLPSEMEIALAHHDIRCAAQTRAERCLFENRGAKMQSPRGDESVDTGFVFSNDDTITLADGVQLLDDRAGNEGGRQDACCGIHRHVFRDADQVAFAHDARKPGTRTGNASGHSVPGRETDDIGADGIHGADRLHPERANANCTQPESNLSGARSKRSACGP
jgi:hypothetical protein